MPDPSLQVILNKINQAITDILTGQAQEVQIGDNKYTALDIAVLKTLRRELRAELQVENDDTLGGFAVAEFQGC